MSHLSELIEAFSSFSKLHICINDFSGILSLKELEIGFENKIHSISFCDIAKNSAKGYAKCLSCKARANKKSLNKKALFCGHCAYGLFEIACPVIIGNDVKCVVYVGNILKDEKKALYRLKHTANETGVSQSALIAQLKNAEICENTDKYIRVAKIIAANIKLLYKQSVSKQTDTKKPESNWIIGEICEYMRKNYMRPITLKSLSHMYFMNEKYLGQLFIRHTKMTFHKYLTVLRLEIAEDFLANTTKSITEISDECGFSDVTYFNRVFKIRHSCSPTEYRKTAAL